jgi:hypothetical protein
MQYKITITQLAEKANFIGLEKRNKLLCRIAHGAGCDHDYKNETVTQSHPYKG